jgi:Uma2 family endonuclease
VRRTAAYPSGKPSVADLLLVIEVADTSLGYDRSEKLPLYARAGMPEVWLVDLTHDVIYVYLKPDRLAGTYSVVSRRRRGGHLAPLFAPEQGLAVDAILGPAQPK